MPTLQEIHGVFGPNAPLGEWREAVGGPVLGAAAYWRMFHDTVHARWFLGNTRDHDWATFARAKQLGLKTIGRIGEGGEVNYEFVAAQLEQYGAVIDVAQIGNEPDRRDWDHCWYLEQVLIHCGPLAARLGVRLCTPGWANGTFAPSIAAAPGTLAARIREVYGRFDLFGFHAYDWAAIVNPAPSGPQPTLSRLASFLAAFPQHFIVSEYGIPYKLVGGAANKHDGDMIKADRMLAALSAFAATGRCEAACWFISGGTESYASFGADQSKYEPDGQNSYWLHPDAWTRLGILVGA
jgi:hypothetical protein